MQRTKTKQFNFLGKIDIRTVYDERFIYRKRNWLMEDLVMFQKCLDFEPKDAAMMCYIGDTYFAQGNIKLALKYFYPEAKLENPHAMSRIGAIYYNRYYSYDNGAFNFDAESDANLLEMGIKSELRIDDNNVKQFCLTNGHHWYSRAAKLNNIDAILAMGHYYRYLIEPKDNKQSLYWNLKAAELNNPVGMYYCGLLYKSVFEDLDKAESFFLKAVREHHHHESLGALGELYMQKNKYSEAVEYFFKYGSAYKMNRLFHLMGVTEQEAFIQKYMTSVETIARLEKDNLALKKEIELLATGKNYIPVANHEMNKY
ncbi:MAG: hypothetical protein Harvfovirus48_4 [Harvfovirus sp.]|uniref:Tetratricopeptide repeat protein n=1 Tax=Harvfovirus sp. TaxID=2487768 RepID=A0A3G5A339_9VIRU|nr:MAG: hypothetical protein Harvfovirus48_4 [Harvfovirus sp.]